MTVFENFKNMSIDDLAKWLDEYGQFDGAPWVDYCPCQIDRNITWATGTVTDTYTNLDAKEFNKYARTHCEELKS